VHNEVVTIADKRSKHALKFLMMASWFERHHIFSTLHLQHQLKIMFNQ